MILCRECRVGLWMKAILTSSLRLLMITGYSSSSICSGMLHGDKRAILQFLVDRCAFRLDMVYWFVYKSFCVSNLDVHKIEKRKQETILYQAACLEGSPEVVEILLSMGAHPDSPGLRRTPLMSLIKRRRYNNAVPITKLLLRYGADANGARDTDHEADGTLKPTLQVTPLLLVLTWDYPEPQIDIVRLLIEHGADVNYGKVSPLHLAYHYGSYQIANLLLQYGAVDRCDSSYTAKSFVRDFC
ncbi:ankyrin repeat-containing domain protein [Aspergillus aurantiobrunneus]